MNYLKEEIQGISFIPPLEFEQRAAKKMQKVQRSFASDAVYSWTVIGALLLCYVAAAASALLCAHSLTGWLVIGLAPVLLLDRLTFRLLSPTGPESRIVQISIRLGYLILGTHGLPYLQNGIVSPWEALFAGGALSLVTFLFEYLIEWCFWLVGSIRGGTAFHAKLAPVNTAMLAVLIALPLVVLHPLMAVHPIRHAPADSPTRLGIAYQDVLLCTSDGLSLAAWYVPVENPRGTVVYCHGYGENRGQVVSLLEPLHEMQLNVLAFDFRGHGNSSGHTATFGHREVRDLEAAWTFARQQSGGKPMFIVGVSYGAAIALQALPRLPDVAGVWVDSSFDRLQNVISGSFAFAPETSRGALAALANTLIRVDCGFWISQVNPIECLRDVRTPLYFCHSTADAATDFKVGQALYDAYAGPKWHFWVEDATREGLSKASQREYYRRLRGFIEHQLQGGTGLQPVSQSTSP
jgi:pimeloyl-ACP methyl ester carboxylesterase